MYMLYPDDAGSVKNPDEKYFVLAGIAVFERQVYWLQDGLEVARSLVQNQWRLFGVAVDKDARAPEGAVEYAFEQICNRFGKFLNRLYHRGFRQQGLIVLDKSAQETRLQSLATEFRTFGHRWSAMRNLLDVPLFVDSKATRGIVHGLHHFRNRNDP